MRPVRRPSCSPISSTTAVAASTSPTIRPSYMTAIRSDSVISSSRSSEMSRIATPAAGRFAQVRVHGLDGADVEPTRRRRDHEHARPTLELAREHDLLQVAARQLAGGCAGPGRLHVVAPDQLDGPVADAVEAEERPGRVLVERYDLRTTFDAMLRLGATPVCRRSSGTCATPACDRRPRVPGRGGRHPRRGSIPAVSGRIPVTASASSRCPFPATPATPRISPARTAQRDVRRRPRRRGRPRPSAPPPRAAPRRSSCSSSCRS